MMLALRTNIQVGFQVGLENRLPATWTLDPQALRANTLLAPIRAPVLRAGAGLVFAVLSLEPGHTEPNCKWIAQPTGPQLLATNRK